MQIKKYAASTLKEALQQMKDELGSEAIILSTRVLPVNGSLNRKKVFEITAGVENEQMPALPKPSVKESTKNFQPSFQDELKKLSDKIYHSPQAKSTGKANTAAGELTKTRKTKPIAEGEADDDEVSVNRYKNKSRRDAAQSNDSSIENELKEIVDTLLHREVKKTVVSAILSQLKKYKNFLQPSNIDSYVLSSIASMVPTYPFEVQKKNKPKVVSLVGPTGVGKTTCIAKLAVISKILHNLDVGLISIDTYRLGALDQLRIFSEISNIDMLVAYEPSDIPGLMNSFKKKDIVFIDTAGRSQKNHDQLSKAKEFLDAAKVDETYLVLSSTSTLKNLFDVAEKFKVYDYDTVIFTKIDEAVAFGNILNVTSSFDVPISFFTNGQVIPDDIISADPEFTASMIYTGKIN
jgi:flagellar biosynthesis protein FlhF